MKWILAFSILFSFAHAEDLNGLKDELLSLKSKVLGDSTRSRKIMAAIYKLNQSMKKINKERSEYEDEIYALKSNVTGLARMVQSLSDDASGKKVILRRRLIAIYKMGGRGLMGALLGSQSSSELDRNIRIINEIVANDFQLISTYKDNMDLMNHKKKVLESRLEELESKKEKVAELEDKLGKQIEMNRKIVRSLKRTRHQSLSKLSRLREHLQAIDIAEEERSLLRTLINPTIYEQKGHLALPVAGPIIQPYGIYSLRGKDIQIRNKGIFIAGPKGSEVKAVFSGDVVFADRFGNQGDVVIIDHGSNYLSVYANTTSLKVNEGDVVKEGDVIAHSGYNAFLGSEGVHFELRYFSAPEDPTKWINKAKNTEISSL